MTAIEAVVRSLAKDLANRHAKWALIGGLAVSVRTEPRFTRDVDVAIAVEDDRAAERLLASLRSGGYQIVLHLEQAAVGRLATVRLQPPAGPASPRVIVDLLFASSGIEAELVASAEPIEIFTNLVVPVPPVGLLIALKLLSESDARPQDANDLRALVAQATPRDLQAARDAVRLIEARGFARGRDLQASLVRWIGTA